MASKPIKTRLVPFRLLTLLLYGSPYWLTRPVDGAVVVRLGPLARTLRVSSSRLKGAFLWLYEADFLHALPEYSPNKAVVYLKRPTAFPDAKKEST